MNRATRRRERRGGVFLRSHDDGSATATATISARATAHGLSPRANTRKPSRARTLAAQTPDPAARALKPTQVQPTSPLASWCWLRSQKAADPAVAQITAASRT